jgi:DNA-binding transcriptional ArsR family regulator
MSLSFPSGEPTVGEIEIETGALRRARSRRRERFLKGPILMRHIGVANRLSGQALALFLAIRHRMDLTGKPVVTLPRSLLDELGVSKDAKSRGLRVLEGAGLIVVDRSKGKATRAGLVRRRGVADLSVIPGAHLHMPMTGFASQQPGSMRLRRPSAGLTTRKRTISTWT